MNLARATVMLRADNRMVDVVVTNPSKPNVDASVLAAWQGIVDVCARVMDVPAGLIMKLHKEKIEALVVSNTEGNPYEKHAAEHLGLGLYCETVVATGMPLTVPNAREDADWRDNPDVALNMVSYFGMPIVWPDGEVFGTICVLDDKTNAYCDKYRSLLESMRKAVETDLALLMSSQRHREGIVEAIPEPAFMIDSGLTITWENDKAIRAFGDGRGKRCHVFFERGRQTPCEKCPVIRALKTDSVCEYDRTVRLVNGEERRFWCTTGVAGRKSSGDPDLVVFTLKDVSERLEAHRRLVDAQYVARLGDFTWDIETGDVSWSEGMYRLLKYDLSDQPNYDLMKNTVHHPDDVDRVNRWLEESIASGREWLSPNEYRLVCKDGEVIDVQANGRILFRDGRPVRLFGTCQDITERKQAEKMLAEQKGLLEAIYQDTPVVILLVDKERRVRQVNVAACRLAHRQAEEMQGLCLGEALGCIHAQKNSEACGLALACKDCILCNTVSVALNQDRTHIQAEGKLMLIEDGKEQTLTLLHIATPLTYGGDKMVLVSLLDISERIAAEEALRASEARVQKKLKAIMEPESDLGVLALSDILDLAQLSILMEEFNRITGLANAIIDMKGDVLVGVGWQDICTKFHRQNPDTLANCIESDTILSRGVAQGSSKAYRCKNGLVDVSTPIMLHGQHVGNIFTGQFFYSDETPDTEQFRHRARQYGFDETAYLAALDRVPRISRKDTESIMSFLSKLAEIVSSLSYSNIRLSKTITERERAEKEKSTLREQLAHTQKMEAIGTLAGGIAHDFNNQLAGIIGYAELLEEHLKDGVPMRYAQNIEKSAMRAAELTKQLLTFSRKGKHIITEINVHDIIGEVCDVLGRSVDKRIEIDRKLGAESDVTFGDPSLLQNAFLNLAINARDAMPDGGVLRFETRNIALELPMCERPPYEVAPGEYILVNVIDTGTGMTEETKHRIFEPFFTTKEEGKGTGMGLASVFGTVKSHKGAIDVQTELGNGTTFLVYLPARERRDEPEKKDEPRTRRGIGNILLAEDEAIVRELGADMLRELGYDVVACENGSEALNRFRESWRDIDLAILDINMPKLNGCEAFHAMKRINPNVRVVITSGYSIDGEVQGMLDDGAMAFLGKPFRKTELSDKVARILSEPVASVGDS